MIALGLDFIDWPLRVAARPGLVRAYAPDAAKCKSRRLSAAGEQSPDSASAATIDRRNQTLESAGRRAHDRAMNRRFALLAALPLLIALTAARPAPRRAPPAPLPDVVRVAMVTELGTIELALDAKRAPVTVRNFLRYAEQRRFDGIFFYRVMRLAWGQQPNGLIQAGTRGDPRRALPPIAHEPTSATGLLHTPGAISMARWAPGTAAGDFSILLSAMPGLDADPKSDNPELQAGFAVFGNVSAGMDVVRRIYDVPLSPTLGEGVMKGQMIARPVRVLTVRRLPAAVSAPALVAPAASSPAPPSVP